MFGGNWDTVWHAADWRKVRGAIPKSFLWVPVRLRDPQSATQQVSHHQSSSAPYGTFCRMPFLRQLNRSR